MSQRSFLCSLSSMEDTGVASRESSEGEAGGERSSASRIETFIASFFSPTCLGFPHPKASSGDQASSQMSAEGTVTRQRGQSDRDREAEDFSTDSPVPRGRPAADSLASGVSEENIKCFSTSLLLHVDSATQDFQCYCCRLLPCSLCP